MSPEIEDWALRDMEERGQSIDEYCNENMLNISDILKDDEDDDY
ncbi:hypothetical protein [Paraclostridium sordellii]|nr:hypothetical protein [Paeniclostridium sordellii]